MYDKEKLMKRIEFCEKAVDEIDFDPFDSLLGEGAREQEIRALCVDFLDGLDLLYDNFTKKSKKILFS